MMLFGLWLPQSLKSLKWGKPILKWIGQMHKDIHLINHFYPKAMQCSARPSCEQPIDHLWKGAEVRNLFEWLWQMSSLQYDQSELARNKIQNKIWSEWTSRSYYYARNKIQIWSGCQRQRYPHQWSPTAWSWTSSWTSSSPPSRCFQCKAFNLWQESSPLEEETEAWSRAFVYAPCLFAVKCEPKTLQC